MREILEMMGKGKVAGHAEKARAAVPKPARTYLSAKVINKGHEASRAGAVAAAVEFHDKKRAGVEHDEQGRHAGDWKKMMLARARVYKNATPLKKGIRR